jgi:hypothetical protein
MGAAKHSGLVNAFKFMHSRHKAIRQSNFLDCLLRNAHFILTNIITFIALQIINF